MLNVILPPPLKKGDQLALFSPSSPGQIKYPQQYEYGKNSLRELGYSIFEFQKNINEVDYRFASPKERAEQLHALFKNPEIHGIVCNIGGYNTIEMLPYINYEIIKENPKFICGYSDSSVLLNAIFYRTKVVTFHGPMVISSFGEYPRPLDYTIKHFQALAQQTMQLPYHFTYPDKWTDEFVEWTGPNWGKKSRNMQDNKGPVWLHKSSQVKQGILLGGNTDSLLNILNTEYFEIPENTILFIEDISVSIEKWAMMVWSLKIRGVFNKINGLLIGKIEGVHSDFLLEMKKVIYEILESEDIIIPVIAELDIGHTAPMMTLPIGATIFIDSNKEKIMLMEFNSSIHVDRNFHTTHQYV